MRLKTSDIGRAKAKVLKQRGLSFSDVEQKYSRGKSFVALSDTEKKAIWVEIIQKSKKQILKLMLE